MAKISQTKDIHNNAVPKPGTIVAYSNQKKRNVTIDPYKYNGVYNYSSSKNNVNQVINVDWLALSLVGRILDIDEDGHIVKPHIIDYGPVRLEYANTGTTHFHALYRIYVGEEKTPFASIETAPRAKVLKIDSIMKVENFQLYRKGWTAKLLYVIKELGHQVNNVSRLDIATDGRGFRQKVEKVENGEWDIVGRAQLSSKGNKTSKYRYKTADGYLYGSASSPKHISIYQKGLSIEGQNKQYIVQNWIANGLISDYSERLGVERAELRLRAKAIDLLIDGEMIDETTGEAFTGVNISRLEDPAYLASITRASFKSYFQFVDKCEREKTGNVSRCKKIDLIDWDEFDTMEMVRLSTTQKPNRVWREKRFAMAAAQWDRNDERQLGAIINDLFRQNGYKGQYIPLELFQGAGMALGAWRASEFDFKEWFHHKTQHKDRTLEAAKFFQKIRTQETMSELKDSESLPLFATTEEREAMREYVSIPAGDNAKQGAKEYLDKFNDGKLWRGYNL